MLVFVHIPKTAGTSFKAPLKKRFPNHYLHGETHPYGVFAQEKSNLSSYDLVAGHLMMADFNEVPGDKQFLTIIRNPITRLLSFYHYVWRRQEHSLHPFSLSGPETFFRTCRDIADNGHPRRPIALNATEVTDGMCLRLAGCRSSERALEVVEKRSIVILRQERLQRDVRERLGWTDFNLPKLNANTKKPECPLALKKLIAEMNREDLALYRAFMQAD